MSDDLIIGLDPSNITAGVDRAEADLRRLRTVVEAVGDIKTPRMKGFREAIVGPITEATKAVESSVGSLTSATRALLDSQKSTVEAHARSMTALVDVAFNNLISSGSRGNSLVLSGQKEFNAQQKALFDTHLADVRSAYAARAAVDSAELARATSAAASLAKAHGNLSSTLGTSTSQYKLEQGRGAELLNSPGGSTLVMQVRQMTDLLVASEAAQSKIDEVTRKLSKLNVSAPHGDMQAMAHAVILQQGMESSDLARQAANAARLADAYKVVDEAEAKALTNMEAARAKAERTRVATKAWLAAKELAQEDVQKGMLTQEAAYNKTLRARPLTQHLPDIDQSAQADLSTYYRGLQAEDAARKAAEDARLAELRAQEAAYNSALRARPMEQYHATPDQSALASMKDFYVSRGATVMPTPNLVEATPSAGSPAVTWTQQRKALQGVYDGMLKDGAEFTAQDLTRMRAHGVALTSTHREVIKSMGETAVGARDLHSAYRGLASGFGALWLTYGSALPILAGAALSTGVLSAVKAGSAVAESLAAIQNMAGASSATVDMLNRSLLETAKAGSPTSIVEMADAYKSLAMAGVDAKDAATALRDIENLSIAGGTSLKTAADTVTTVAVAFGVNANAYSHISDVIFTASAMSKASVDTMSQAFKNASVVNTMYGVSLEDVGVGLALLHNAGIQGSAAGTSLANMYADLTGRTDKARKALDSLGLKFTDSSGKVKDLVGIASTLMPVLDKMNPDAVRKFMQSFSDTRGMKELVQVLQTSREQVLLLGVDAAHASSTVLQSLSQAVADSAGSASIAAAAQMLTPLNQMKMAANSLEGALVGAFQSAQPEIISASRALREMASSSEFQNLTRNIVGGALDIAETLAKAAPVVVFFGQALLGVGAAFTAQYALDALSKGVARLSGMLALTGAEAIAATTALRGAGAAAGAAALGTEALTLGLTATTGAVAWLGGALSALAPWLAVIAGAYTLYEMSRNRAAEDPSKGKAAETHKEFMERLKEEETRLNLATEALQKHMGVKELENATLLGQMRAELQTKQTILAANQAYVAPYTHVTRTAEGAVDSVVRTATGVSIPSDLQYRRQVLRDTEAEVTVLGEKVSAMERVQVATKNAADEQKKQSEAQKKTLGTPGGAGWNMPPPAHDASSLLDDLTRQSDRKIKLIDETMKQGERLIKLRNDANLMTDADYFAQSNKMEEDAQAQKLEELARFSKEYAAQYLKERAAIPADRPDKIKNLDARNVETTAKTADKEAEIVQASLFRVQDTVARLAKQYGSAEDAAKKFWSAEAKAIEVADARNEAALQFAVVNASMFSGDKQYQASVTASKEATAGYTEELAKLKQNLKDVTDTRQKYLDSTQAGFESASANGDAKALGNYSAVSQGLNQAVDLAQSTLESATVNATKDALLRGAQAAKAVAITQMIELSTAISSAIESAVSTGGGTGAKALRKLLETELLRKPFVAEVQLLLNPILQSLGFGGGSSASGTAGAQSQPGLLSSLGSMSSMASAANSLGLSEAAGFMTNFGNSVVATTQSMAGLSGTTAQMASSLSSAGAAGGNALATTLGSYVPYIAAVMVVADQWKSIFGGKTSVQGMGIDATVSGSTVSSRSYTDYRESGGWFKSGKSWTDYGSPTPAVSRQLQDVVTAASTAAKALGLSSTALDTYSEHFQVSLGTDDAKNQAAITKALSDLADHLATAVAPGAADLAKAGETSGQTLSRLSSSITTTNSWLSVLKQRLFAVSLSGADAASSLVDAFGSLDNFTSAAKAFRDSYYTDAEKIASSQELMTKALAAVNLTLPTSKTAFRDLANSLDLNTDSGRKAYETLLALAPEFDTATTAIDKLASDTSAKIMTAFTGGGNLTSALDASGKAIAGVSFSLGTLSPLPVYATMTQVQAYLSSLDPHTLGETVTQINSAMGDATSAVRSFVIATYDANAPLTAAQSATLSLNDQITSLKSSVDTAKINFGGLQTALSGVNTETFVTTLNAVFTNLGTRIRSVIDSISAERVALRDAAVNIVNPTVMTRDQIQTQISGINAYLPSNGALVSANNASTAADAAVKTAQQSQIDSYANLSTKKAALADAQAAYTGYSADMPLTGPTPTGAKYLEAWRFLEGAQTAATAADAALATAQNAQTAAAAAAKKAALDYAQALQDFSIDANNSVSKLTKLREETVKYYEAQAKLADLMTTSANGLRKTVADYQFSQMTDAQKYNSLAQDFSKYYSLALATTGEVSAGYADKLNALITPLIDASNNVGGTSLVSGASAQSLINSYLTQAASVATKLDTNVTALGNYQADSLTLLNNIDTTLASLDESSRSVEQVISAAVAAGADETTQGLRAVVAALTGAPVPAFATGGAFTNGVVSRPTLFNMGQMGEAGSEGILPLTNVGGRLGVYAKTGEGPDNSELVAELRALRAEVAELRRSNTAGQAAIASNTLETAKLHDRWDRTGLLVSSIVETF